MFGLLLLSVLVIIASIVSNKISDKLGIPALLAFIVLGMLFGSDGIVKIPFSDFELAEKICSVALAFIIFYGGFGTKWKKASPVAVQSVLLSTLGVIITAAVVGMFCHFVLKFDLLESLLIGSVISSTDAASVFSILRSKKLNLKYNTASLLEVESGSNDPCSYMLTVIILSLMLGQGVSNETGVAYMIFSQIIYGIGFGLFTAFAVLWVTKKFRIMTEGFDTVFLFASVLFSYAAPSMLGGNGYLSVYIFGIIIGNGQLNNKRMLVHFFDGITGLMQILVFFLLGLLSFPSKLLDVAVPALCIALFLTFVARPLSVFLLLSPFRCRWNQQLLVSFAGLRGAASIVFAIIATIHPAYVNNDVFHIIFFIVLFSILFQGSLLPFISGKLNMVSHDDDVLKTFNDYSDEAPVRFIDFTISEHHLWAGKRVKDIILPPETLLVRLLRNNIVITPVGSTMLESGDILTLSAQASKVGESHELTEIILSGNDERIGQKLSAIGLEQGKLVIMILRNSGIVIPHGDTILKDKDVLVIQSEKKSTK